MLKLSHPLFCHFYFFTYINLFIVPQPEFSQGQKELKCVNQMSTAALMFVQGAAITIIKGGERAAWAGCVEAVRVGVPDVYETRLR